MHGVADELCTQLVTQRAVHSAQLTASHCQRKETFDMDSVHRQLEGLRRQHRLFQPHK